MKKTFRNFVIIASLATISPAALNAAPLDSDSRIQTLVFNDNDVYRVVARNGFQTTIELAEDEIIDTMSIGDSIGWQLTPAVRRIFVKPLQKNGVTNLSVITNRRTYQFELVATGAGSKATNNAYVVKFYYPDAEIRKPEIDRSRGSLRPVSATDVPELPTAPMSMQVPAAPSMAPTPPAAPAVKKTPTLPIQPVITTTENFNFNYTLTGPETAAPVKIYDDGRSTFFQFRGITSAPQFAVIRPDGTEVPVAARPQPNGLAVVDQLSDKFVIRVGSDVVNVYNEKLSLPPVPSTRPY